MKRRNFLAFIPALGAAPLIGSNYERTEKGIFLEKPAELTECGPLKPLGPCSVKTPWSDLTLAILNKEGEIVSYARATGLTATGALNGPMTAQIEGEVIFVNELFQAIG